MPKRSRSDDRLPPGSGPSRCDERARRRAGQPVRWRERLVSRRLPVPQDVIEDMRLEVGAETSGRGSRWASMERRLARTVRSHLPVGARGVDITLDASRHEILLCYHVRIGRVH